MTLANLFLFILQIIICFLLIVCVLFQSSDEDSLSGIGAGAVQANALSHKSSLDGITKITIFLGVALMLNSFLLASISTHKYYRENNKIQDYLNTNKKTRVYEERENTEEVNNKIGESIDDTKNPDENYKSKITNNK